jgi:putative aldouronate transport system permease protein
MPTVAVLILYYAVAHWNAWFNAMIYLRTRTKFPLQLILREILIQNDTTAMTATSGVDSGEQLAIAETIRYATIIVATVPILCVYPFLQKYFIKGVMVGAVKG